MAMEIEKRFLLLKCPDLGEVAAVPIKQGYLSTDPAKTVRIRRIGDEAVFTVKGLRVDSAAPEFEYPLPVPDADAMMAMCGDHILTKNRVTVPAADSLLHWEVDFFTGRHDGLMIAEIELPDRDAKFVKPDWLYGHDISNDNRFSNAALTLISSDDLAALLTEYKRKMPPAVQLNARLVPALAPATP